MTAVVLQPSLLINLLEFFFYFFFFTSNLLPHQPANRPPPPPLCSPVICMWFAVSLQTNNLVAKHEGKPLGGALGSTTQRETSHRRTTIQQQLVKLIHEWSEKAAAHSVAPPGGEFSSSSQWEDPPHTKLDQTGNEAAPGKQRARERDDDEDLVDKLWFLFCFSLPIMTIAAQHLWRFLISHPG